MQCVTGLRIDRLMGGFGGKEGVWLAAVWKGGNACEAEWSKPVCVVHGPGGRGEEVKEDNKARQSNLQNDGKSMRPLGACVSLSCFL